MNQNKKIEATVPRFNHQPTPSTMPRYNTRLQAKLALTNPVVTPVRKYNTRLQVKKDTLNEISQMSKLMSCVPSHGDNFVEINNCFEFLCSHQNLLRNHSMFRKTVENKIEDFLANQIPLKMKSYGFYLVESTSVKQLLQLKSTIQKVKEIITKEMVA